MHLNQTKYCAAINYLSFVTIIVQAFLKNTLEQFNTFKIVFEVKKNNVWSHKKVAIFTWDMSQNVESSSTI